MTLSDWGEEQDEEVPDEQRLRKLVEDLEA
jgi:hypothetical protein